MNTIELEVARRRKRRSRKDMADVIGKSPTSYGMKESGRVPFSVDEIVSVAEDLELTLGQVNIIFFDGKLRVSA